MIYGRGEGPNEWEARARVMGSFLAWIDDLPVERIKAADFFRLPEYSASIPTGVTIGKRWRCLVGSHDPFFRGKPRWVIREYVEAKDQNMASVAQYRPIIIAERPEYVRIEFKGTKYIWMKHSDGEGAIAPMEHFDSSGEMIIYHGLFSESFAHVFSDGGIYRHGECIGTVDDLVFL